MTDSTPVNLPKTAAAKRRSFASMRAIAALILREMSSSYGRSPGGYLWAVLEPVAGIALLSFIFSAFMRSPSLGISFPMFYASGLLVFNMYNDIQSKSATALLYSKQLLAYPTVTFVDALLARFILTTMTQLMVSYIVVLGCLMVFETRVTLDLPVIILSFALSALLGLSIGVLNCYAFTRVPLLRRAWAILMRPMVLISGIIFLFDVIPPQYQTYLWYNPLIHLVGLSRSGFYSTYHADYVSVPYVLGLSIVCMAAGLTLLWRNHRDLLTL